MFRKKKRNRNKGGKSWVSLYEFDPTNSYFSKTSKKGKKTKIFKYSKEEIECICSSLETTKDVKIYSTW